MLLNKFIGCAASKHGGAGQEVVEHSSQRVDISVRTDRLAKQLLWGSPLTHLLGQILRCVLPVQLKQAPHAKISHDQVPIEPDENTIHRETAMENRVFMSLFQGSGNLIQVATNSEDIQWPILGKTGTQ